MLFKEASIEFPVFYLATEIPPLHPLIFIKIKNKGWGGGFWVGLGQINFRIVPKSEDKDGIYPRRFSLILHFFLNFIAHKFKHTTLTLNKSQN